VSHFDFAIFQDGRQVLKMAAKAEMHSKWVALLT
jgi:hypothetical protein